MQVDFGDEAETEHSLHLTANAHQHYEHSGPGSGPAYSPFRHPGGGRVPAIDPGLEQSTGASRNVHTPMSAVPHQAQSSHLLQPDNASHLAHGFYGDMRSSQTPPASANASPRFAQISPTSQPRQRWMRAMHIDAFFEYLLGKQHPYFLQIPHPHNPFPSEGRDGVPLEEDLAIRALDPKFKPKRGRRKAEDGDDDIDFDEGTPAPPISVSYKRPSQQHPRRLSHTSRPMDFSLSRHALFSFDSSFSTKSSRSE
ncbi:hypothetical protein CUC08_Gglean004576 [Alternaria sp. MG1]|nr:hypothetical protein CUC08_Gglean004576 [Alternaria sp. MG1]